MGTDLSGIAEPEPIRAAFDDVYYFVSDVERHQQRTVAKLDLINIILGGSYSAEIAGRRLTAWPGDVVFAPRGVPRVERNEPPGPLRCLAVSLRWQNPPRGLPFLRRDKGGRIRMLAEWLHAGRDLPSPSWQHIADSYLRAMLGEYLRLCLAEVEHEWVHEVRRYVQDRIEERITLEELAAHFHVSKYHFVRKFKKMTGETPMAAVRRMRVELARDLVLNTELTLSEIALKVGITNQYHLSRLFRKILGVGVQDLRRGRG